MSAPVQELDVSIVTFNSARWIDAFLDSLLAQRHPALQINLWVRDNGSESAEFEHCEAAIGARTAAFAKVHVERGENIGFGSGHNRNFVRGRAEFFLVTNVDLEFDADSIATALAALQSDAPRVACREFRQQPYEHPKHYHPATLETAWCSSACILFRRGAFASVNGYEERIFLYGEDVELSFRLRDRGHVLKYCPAAACIHHSYDLPGTTKPAQFFGSREANFYVRLRYGSLLDILCGVLLQLALWISPPRGEGYHSRLAAAAGRMARNTPYFLRSRRRGQRFEFRLWDYGPRREGAWYQRPALDPPLPLVSIIVRTYAGRLEWLHEALASIARQTYRRIEVILIEDGSRAAADDAEALARSDRFERVHYVSIPKGGRCRAGNAGLADAQGDFIGFLDDDDLFYADHVETLVAELTQSPTNAAVYGLAFEIPTSLVSQVPFRYRESRPMKMHDRAFSRQALLQRNFLPIQSVLFRRECFQRHGGFDTALDLLEDWDLWTRYSADAEFRRVPKTTSLYRVPAEALELASRNARLEESARRRRGSLPVASAGPMSARTALNLMTWLPFLRPLYLPSRRLAAWLRRPSTA